MTTRAAKTSDAALTQTITREVAKRVVGQEVLVERLLIGLLTGGHILLEGVPGLAKTLAMQNPIEHEGTYPLPEAQLDRFMLKVRVDYPSRDAEKEIVGRMAGGRPIEVTRVAEAEDILAARSAIAELFMDQKVVDYIVDAVRA